MASAKTAICFSLALFATASIFSTANASVLGTAAYNPFCSNSDDLNLCAHLANGACTWAESMTNTLQSVLNKVKPEKENSILRQIEASGGLQAPGQGIHSRHIDPYSSLDTYLSATTSTDCTNGLQEFGVNLPEVADFDKEILKLSSVLLTVAQLKTA
ncbi:hypothetical protein OROMI_008179 [Orobanche minor]